MRCPQARAAAGGYLACNVVLLPLLLALLPRLVPLQVFTAISDELRAKSNAEMDKSGIHK